MNIHACRALAGGVAGSAGNRAVGRAAVDGANGRGCGVTERGHVGGGRPGAHQHCRGVQQQ